MTRILKCIIVVMLAASVMGTPATRPTGSVSLAWDRVTDSSVSEVRIYYGEESRKYEGFFAVPADKNTCVVSGLELGHEYFFTGTAVNPAGESPYSNEVNYTFYGLPRAEVPAPPFGLSTNQK